MSDLIERLREVPFVGFIYEGQAGQEDPGVCLEAAEALEAKDAEIARLREALDAAVSLVNQIDPHDRPDWANAGTWAHCAEVYAMRISEIRAALGD